MKNNFKEIRIVVFLPTLFGGGAEETFIRLVSYLNDNDYDTTLLIGTSNTSSIYEKEIGNRVKVIESPRLRYSILKIFKYLKNAKPDLVISTLWYANIMIFLICKFLGIKTILREAGNDYRVDNNFLSKLKSLIIKLAYSNADKTIVISDYLKKDLTDNLSIDFSKIIRIYNPVESYIDKSNLKKINLNNYFFNTNKETKYVVCASRLDKVKGIDFLIEAFNELKSQNIKLIILGDGTEKDKYKNLIKKNDLDETVQLIGWVENVYDFIYSCDAYVSPSRFEGLGNAYIAAHILNKRCLSSKIGASIEINDLFKSGTVFEYNSLDFNNELINLLNSDEPEESDINKFTEHYCFKKYIDILEEVIY